MATQRIYGSLDVQGTLTVSNTPVGTQSTFANTFTLTTNTTLSSGQANRNIILNGSNIVMTLPSSLTNVGTDFFYFLNINTSPVTLASGTDFFNRTNVANVTLQQDQTAIVVYANAAAPKWSTGFDDFLLLSSNQLASETNAGTGLEGRTQKDFLFAASIAGQNGANVNTTGATNVTVLAKPFPGNLSAVRMVSVGDVANVKIWKSGVAINGFSSAVAVTTSATNTTSTESFLGLEPVTVQFLTAGPNCTGISVQGIGTRTGD